MKIIIIIISITSLTIGWIILMVKQTYPLSAEQIDDQDIDQFTRNLISQMSLREKLKQVTGESLIRGTIKLFVSEMVLKKMIRVYSGFNKRLGIPAFSFSDGPRGVVVGKNKTAWPVNMARGASFDTDLEKRIGIAIGKEMKSGGANYFGGVTINLLRHPRWGRAQETYGEDPWLLGEMGKALVTGVQDQGIMACAKHFALNNIENSRFYLDVEVDDRTLHEVYLFHFKKVVVEGKVASIMSSYNLINGVHASENRRLLKTILRDDWGFKGFVTSDWIFGVRSSIGGLLAGNDVEMPMPLYYGRKLRKALKKGNAEIADLDDVLFRIIRTKLLFGQKNSAKAFQIKNDGFREHSLLALEAVEKSTVLLKNSGCLPINSQRVKKIALIGELADTINLGDEGTSNIVRYPYAVTPRQGITNYLRDKPVDVHYSDGKDLSEAVSLAKEADVAIVLAGFTSHEEGEFLSLNANGPGKQLTGLVTAPGGDRKNLRLPDKQVELIKAVARVATKSVVVYEGGSAIVVDDWKDLASAIIFLWYPGMEGGTGLARLLFGEVNFSGKLPLTIPEREDDLPYFSSTDRFIRYGYYHGYTLLDKMKIKPAYPFGFGLSYTRFQYDNLVVDSPEVSSTDTLRVRLDVSNVGPVEGDEIVFLFVGFPHSKVDRPVKLLRNFIRVSLSPGETRNVALSVRASDLSWYNPISQCHEVEKVSHEVYVGGSSDDRELLMGEFRII